METLVLPRSRTKQRLCVIAACIGGVRSQHLCIPPRTDPGKVGRKHSDTKSSCVFSCHAVPRFKVLVPFLCFPPTMRQATQANSAGCEVRGAQVRKFGSDAGAGSLRTRWCAGCIMQHATPPLPPPPQQCLADATNSHVRKERAARGGSATREARLARNSTVAAACTPQPSPTPLRNQF